MARVDPVLLRLHPPCPADFYNESPIGNLCGGERVGIVSLLNYMTCVTTLLALYSWKTPIKFNDDF